MQSYPLAFLAHLQPLVHIHVSAELNENELVLSCLEVLSRWNERNIWQSGAVRDPTQGKLTSILYRVQKVSDLHAASVLYNGAGHKKLHPSLSPLHPEAPLYPDGLIGVQWIERYQSSIPCMVVEVVKIPKDVSSDERLAVEMARLKGFYNPYGIITVFALACEAEPIATERLNNLRRFAGLDARYLVNVAANDLEMHVKIKAALLNLSSEAINFYREKAKNTKRRRSRSLNAVPSEMTPLPNTGILSRYDYKLGVFAEIQQDFETASRSYEVAYEGIITLLETTAYTPRSQRWNEARMLLDTMALRICRNLLYANAFSSSSRRFNAHTLCVSSLISGKGMGPELYDYWAWLSLQNRCFAQLCSNISHSTFPDHVVARIERGLNALAVDPQDTLHQPGFYYRQAAHYSEERIKHARGNIDVRNTYMVAEPKNEAKTDYFELLTNDLLIARNCFQEVGASSWVLNISLELAIVHQRFQHYEKALELFLESAASFRREKFLVPLSTALNAALVCARCLGKKDMANLVGFELLSRELPFMAETPLFDYVVNTRNDPGLHAVLNSNDLYSPIRAQVVFGLNSIHVGSTVSIQVTIESCMRDDAPQIKLTELLIRLGEPLRSIHLLHSSQLASQAFEEVGATRSEDDVVGGELNFSVNLNWKANEVRTFQFSQIIRTPGHGRALQAEFKLTSPFPLQLLYDVSNVNRRLAHWVSMEDGKRRITAVRREEVSVIKILPRLPRLKINVDFHGSAYFNEKLQLPLQIANKEEEDIIVTAMTLLPSDNSFPVSFASFDELSTEKHSDTNLAPEAEITQYLYLIVPSNTNNISFELIADYYRQSDPEVKISQSLQIDLPVSEPFRLDFKMRPLKSSLWPSIFDTQEGVSRVGDEIIQHWDLEVNMECQSLSAENVKVAKLRLERLPLACAETSLELQPDCILSSEISKMVGHFSLQMQRHADEEGSNLFVDTTLVIQWIRERGTNVAMNTLTVPLVHISVGQLEPRVLLEVEISDNRILATLHIENSTRYLLQLNVTSEGSDDFAMSGPRLVALKILPLSQRLIRFDLYATKKGNLRLPFFKIVDVNFKKSLLPMLISTGVTEESESHRFTVEYGA